MSEIPKVCQSQGTEKALPVSLTDFCRAVEQHAIISITDAAGDILYVNQLFCDISGYSPAELIGENHRIIKSAQHPPEVYRDMWETISAGQTWHGEVCNLRKCGEVYWVKATIVPVLDDNALPLYYISTRTDITEQKLQLLRLNHVTQEQDELLRLAPFGIARLQQRRFSRTNEEFAAILGYTKDELLNCSTRDIYFSDEQFAETGAAAYEPLARGEVVRFETELKKKDGSAIWVAAGGCSLDFKNPMADTLFMIQDITGHKQLESELAAAMEQAQAANHAKSVFLDSMAHEVHTPLNGILGTGQIIESMLDDPELKALSAVANDSARALLRMMDMALNYAELEDATPQLALQPLQPLQPCAPNECIQAVMWQSRTAAARFGVTLIDATTPGTWSREFRSDQKKLTQLLELVMDNAIRFNCDGGSVTVTTTETSDQLLISITDTGVGMTQEQVDRIAEPFTRFCNDGNRSGFGLGMALATRLARLIKASIAIDSEPGRGTTVTISIPRNT